MVSIRSNLVSTSSLPSSISTKTAGPSWLRMCVTRSMGAFEGTCGMAAPITSRMTSLRRSFPCSARLRIWSSKTVPTDLSFFEDGQLRNILLLHGLSAWKTVWYGPTTIGLARLAVLVLHADHVGGGERDFRIGVAVFAHPAVVVNFAEVAASGVGHKCDDHIALLAGLRHAQRRGDAAAARAAGENPFLLREAARPDETFLVVHLNHVIENCEIHGAGENIFADSFDDVGVRLADVAGFRHIRNKASRRDPRRSF